MDLGDDVTGSVPKPAPVTSEDSNTPTFSALVSTPSDSTDKNLPVVSGTSDAVQQPKVAPVRVRPTCVLCKGGHRFQRCPRLRKLSVEKRLRLTVRFRLCANCLNDSHKADACPSQYRCRECKAKHHTLLHHTDGPVAASSVRQDKAPRRPKVGRPSRDNHRTRNNKSTQAASSNSALQNSLAMVHPIPNVGPSFPFMHTLAPTLVVLLSLHGRKIPVRALLDTCSEISHVSSALVRQLAIPTDTISGSHFCNLTIASTYEPDQVVQFAARVGDLRNAVSPSKSAPASIRQHFAGFQLADPNFHQSSPIALVLGPELYPRISRQITIARPGLPVAQCTIFGFILSGPVPNF